MDSYLSAPSLSNERPARVVRAVIEFLEGDLSRVPVVYPATGSDEMDDAVCREIAKRWARG